jgi:hypothetical protein
VDRPWFHCHLRGRHDTIEHSAARRQGIGATSLTFTVRGLVVPRLRVSEPSLVLVRHGQKILTWNHRRLVVPAGSAVAIAAGGIVDIVNRPSTEGIYEEVWLSADGAFRVSGSLDRRALDGAAVAIDQPSLELRAAFDRAVEAITARNAVPFDIARGRIAEVMRRAGLITGIEYQRAAGAFEGSNVAVTEIATGAGAPLT